MTPCARQYIQQRSVTSVDGCWLWTNCLDQDGYGVARKDGRQWKAHRLSWVTYRGEIPDDLTLDHLCRVRECVNPAHLEPVTSLVNWLRGTGRDALLATARRVGSKTHCKHGHLLAGGNVRVIPRPKGRTARLCVTCARAANNESYRRRQDQLSA